MAALVFPPHVRFVNPEGKLTKEALDIFTVLLQRVGGATSISITELQISDDEDSGLEEFRHENNKALDALAMFPPASSFVVEQLQSEVNELRERVAVLTTQINDLQQGPTNGSDS
jgi:hypothetical protein